ncbi:reverse transcriptase [Senna tora]|uniref:Reverse transcriptase n=1 Tax=Senna tora TaxID=362788 RepID=A0A834TTW0_9FABA|nr:reverse transcriptase [Senna tora]
MLKKARAEPIVISVMGNLKRKRGRTTQSFLTLDNELHQEDLQAEPLHKKPRCVTEDEELKGLGCSPTASRLKQLVNQYSPDVLNKMKWSDFDYMECVEARGKSGGLCLCWSNSIMLSIMDKSPNWTHAVGIDNNGDRFVLTAVYGPPKLHHRHKLWTFLESINETQLPWIIFGDFNQIKSANEKLSKCNTSRGSLEFNNMINMLRLMEIPSKGAFYTWTNGRTTQEVVWEKLDRCLVNIHWNNYYPNSIVEVLPITRAKQLWLKDGDQNTRYFHVMVNLRKKNKINGIMSSDGNWVTSPEDIKTTAEHYFHWLYQNEAIQERSLLKDYISSANMVKLSDEHLRSLNQVFTKMEIENAMFQMEGDKTPGPDGFPVKFLQENWNLVSNDITRLVSSFLQRGYMLQHLNKTNIVMIPKVDEPKSPRDFRLISLCNVVYKVISKVITNILQLIMPDIITPFQNAFVKNRQIADNIILADHWIKLIMHCVPTPTYNILINGDLTNTIHPKSSLRQGDPLSPYLFIMCMNVLSHIFTKAQNEGRIKGLKASRQSQRINHLFFADDSMLFFKADIESCTIVSNIWREFGSYSGLAMNLDKTEIKFNPNTPRRFQKLLRQTLGCRITNKFKKYLGAKIDSSARDKVQFQTIYSNLQDKLQSWKGKLLSVAGRFTLIKSVLTSRSLYHLSYYKLTKTEAMKCDSLLAHFFWESNRQRNRPHMLNWDAICKPLNLGGLGIKNFSEFNQALLAIQIWRIITQTNTLLNQIMRAKYCTSDGNIGFNCPQTASKQLKDIFSAKEVILSHLKWQVGTGHNIPLNHANWPTLIKNLHDLVNRGEDKLYWSGNKEGIYKVKDGYDKLTESRNINPSQFRFKAWKEYWKIKLPHKILMFGWKLRHNRLPIAENLLKRNFNIQGMCVFGCDLLETQSIYSWNALLLRQFGLGLIMHKDIHPNDIINLSKDMKIIWKLGMGEKEDMSVTANRRFRNEDVQGSNSFHTNNFCVYVCWKQNKRNKTRIWGAFYSAESGHPVPIVGMVAPLEEHLDGTMLKGIRETIQILKNYYNQRAMIYMHHKRMVTQLNGKTPFNNFWGSVARDIYTLISNFTFFLCTFIDFIDTAPLNYLRGAQFLHHCLSSSFPHCVEDRLILIFVVLILIMKRKPQPAAEGNLQCYNYTNFILVEPQSRFPHFIFGKNKLESKTRLFSRLQLYDYENVDDSSVQVVFIAYK